MGEIAAGLKGDLIHHMRKQLGRRTQEPGGIRLRRRAS
jgi:hypothetical protein